MDKNFIYALCASSFVSILSFIGAVVLLLKERLLNSILIFLVATSAGCLMGGAFFHLLPESIELSKNAVHTSIYVIAGFIVFFVLERYLHWRHCHKDRCSIHAFSYLNLIGDGVHNLFDGLIIGASFVVDVSVGLTTTFAIIMHEIPQELGDFGVLIYGGFSKTKALFYNFLSGATAIIGTLIGYHFSNHVSTLQEVILAAAAGGFIYIAACDLIPELHKQSDAKRSTLSMIFFIIGVVFMLLLKVKFGA